MVKTGLMIGFISVVTVIGVAVGRRSTVIDGRVMANDLLPRLQQTRRDLHHLECDREIPVGVDGARFRCMLVAVDGSTALAEYSMDRDGSYEERIYSGARSRGRTGADPFLPD